LATNVRGFQERWKAVRPAGSVISTSTTPVRAVDAATVTSKENRVPTRTVAGSGATLVDHPFCVNTGADAPWLGTITAATTVARVMTTDNSGDRLGPSEGGSVARRRRRVSMVPPRRDRVMLTTRP
jgi:hypothetical protein